MSSPHTSIAQRLERLNRVPQYEQRTPAWYEVRRSLMTASNAAAALGIKPFDSFSGDVRRDAIENIVHRKFKGNIATRHGVKHEDMVRDLFDQIVGKRTVEFGLIIHGDVHGEEKGLPWLAASPDGITIPDGEMVEIKCPWRRQIVPGEVPHHYLPQIQCQLHVCDLLLCYFVEWQPAHLSHTGEEVINIVPVARDESWLERNHDKLKSFYDELMEERRNWLPPPPPTCLVRDDLYADLLSTKRSRLMFESESDEDVVPLFVDDP